MRAFIFVALAVVGLLGITAHLFPQTVADLGPIPADAPEDPRALADAALALTAPVPEAKADPFAFPFATDEIDPGIPIPPPPKPWHLACGCGCEGTGPCDCRQCPTHMEAPKPPNLYDKSFYDRAWAESKQRQRPIVVWSHVVPRSKGLDDVSWCRWDGYRKDPGIAVGRWINGELIEVQTLPPEATTEEIRRAAFPPPVAHTFAPTYYVPALANCRT